VFNIARKARWMGLAHHDGIGLTASPQGFSLNLILRALVPS